MSFSWWLKDRDGKDLFEEFGVNSQALNLGPNGEGATEAPYRVTEIRTAWTNIPYKDKLPEAAQDALIAVQAMVSLNKNSLLVEQHCETCACTSGNEYRAPKCWSLEAIDALLAIPIERAHSAGGGY